jgi:hypothetical protein
MGIRVALWSTPRAGGADGGWTHHLRAWAASLRLPDVQYLPQAIPTLMSGMVAWSTWTPCVMSCPVSSAIS